MSEPKRYILDTSIILQHPDILSRAGSRHLVVPEVVLKELLSLTRDNARVGIVDLIKQASKKGITVAPSPASVTNDYSASDRDSRRMSDVDIEIARVALDYAHRLSPSLVCVVTADRDLAMFLAARGLASVSGTEFLNASINDEKDIEIQSAAYSFIRTQWLKVALSIGYGLIGSLLGNYVYLNATYLINTFSVWGTFLALLLIGVLLYWFRQRYRLSYGIFEFFVGVMMSYYVLFPEFDYSALSTVEAIQILGGLYVMVRGLDNIGKGIEGTRLAPGWKRIFG